MKIIQPISIWYNGQMIAATIFNLDSISDNLSTTATFFYQLYSAENIALTNGNLTMDGTDYTSYCTNTDSNNYAYEWAATKLGLTIIGDVPFSEEIIAN